MNKPNRMFHKELIFHDLEEPLLLYGERDQNIRFLEKKFHVSIFPKENGVRIEGSDNDVILTEKALKCLYDSSKKGDNIEQRDLEIIVHQIKKDENFYPNKLAQQEIFIPKTGKSVKPKTTHQGEYLKAITHHDLVFGLGPAGTGKTYLAVAQGLIALLQNRIQKLILTRPVVEAGENLGFLPGDMQEKVNPYLRPLLDAIFDMISYEDFMKYKEREQIEIAPLAYMRGRTLNNSFTILDEAQNTTKGQLKMFLTRLGPTSKTVITGDLTQIDLPKKQDSGLFIAKKILKPIQEIKFIYFDQRDVVRHSLVRKIIKAYEDREDE